jgi:hypothetical protein
MISGSDVGNVNIQLVDPTPQAPPPPMTKALFPGDGELVGLWSAPQSQQGEQLADHFNVYCSTTMNPGPTNHSIMRTLPPSEFVFIGQLVNGTTYYCAVSSLLGNLESAPANFPTPATVGPVAGGSKVSGTVSFPGITPTGPLLLLAVNPNGGNVAYIMQIDKPTSPQPFAIAGVPDGTLFVVAELDQNANGTFDAAEPRAADQLQVSGPTTAMPLVFPSSGVIPRVNTEHRKDPGQGETYRLDLVLAPNTKTPVNATLVAGFNVNTPLDIGHDRGSFPYMLEYLAQLPFGGTPPSKGANYTIDVAYGDGTTELVTATAGDVLALATPTSPIGVAAAPLTFVWAAPNPPPQFYSYQLTVFGMSGDLWRTQLASTMTSIMYAGPPLTSGMGYNWSLEVDDGLGNRSVVVTQFTAP